MEKNPISGLSIKVALPFPTTPSQTLNSYVNNDVHDATAPRNKATLSSNHPGPVSTPTLKFGVSWGRFEDGRSILRRPPLTVAAPIRSMTSRLNTCRGSAGGEVSVGPRPSLLLIVRFVCSVRHHMKYCI